MSRSSLSKFIFAKLKLVLFLTAASSLMLQGFKPYPLVRFTVVNKSGYPLGIRLEAVRESEDPRPDLFYYLDVPEGDPHALQVVTFTIGRDRYTMQIYYIEYYDPVYGWTCDSPASGKLDARHNVRLMVPGCGVNPPNGGEPSLEKFGGASGNQRRR
jgi:hypothetical protein